MVKIFRGLLAFIIFVFIILFLYFRLDVYLSRIFSIFELPRPLWGQAYSNMFDDKEGKRGILARVTENGFWMWRGFTLSYVQVNGDTVYSYWRACETLNSKDIKKIISRDVFNQHSIWKNKVDSGRVVVVNYLGDVSGVVAREVSAYDWKTYLPLPATLEMQCQK